MISGIDLLKTVEYSLPDDKDNPTVWEIGIVSPIIWAKLSNFSVDDQDNRIAFLIKAVQYGVKGWINFNIEYKTEKEIIFDAEVTKIPMSIIQAIPILTLSELGRKVIEINTLTPEEIKN